MKKTEKLKEIIKNSKKICVFTGAGISCPSGIPDFRSQDGLYNQQSNCEFTPEEIISHTFFENHTKMFYEFYKKNMVYPNALPNAAHKYFAELEKHGKDVTVVTQNIDGLHQKAGSSKVYELHGSVLRNYCTKCGKSYGVESIIDSKDVPVCDKDGGIIKPDVVLYEEPLNENVVEVALAAIESADTMIVIGTSLVVYPAASYVRFFRGEKLVLINKSETQYDSRADLTINDDIIKVVNELENI